MNSQENSNFPLTRISLIERVQDLDGSIRRKALEEFVVSYRPALINFLVRCKNVDVVEAEDLVQDFLLNKVMNGKVLELAGRKGRFRSLLRTCIQNHLIDSLRRKNRQRVDDQVDLSIEDPIENSVNDPIDQVWAIAIFRESLTLMKRESEYWGLFFDRVLTQPPLEYNGLVAKYGLENPAKASNALMTAKRQFNRIIEGIIAKQSYLTDESTSGEIAREIEFLRSQLADSQLLSEIIASLSNESCGPVTGGTELDETIFGERLLLIDESADSNWSKTEAKSILDHILSRPVSEFTEGGHQYASIQSLFSSASNTNPSSLEIIQQLKNRFNQDTKTGIGPLPERVNITMTFAAIGAYILGGGSVREITSTRAEVLRERFGQLLEKDWIPAEIISICRKAAERLPGHNR